MQAMMGTKESIPVAFAAEGYTSRLVEWGGMTVEYWTAEREMDPAEFFRGLPNDHCQCPHWGYLIRGELRYRYPDGDQVLKAGDVYYVAPNHLPLIAPGSEGVEFSPKDEYDRTAEVIARNLQGLNAGDQ